ncbi:hypothetical protein Zmor_005286 [Zophobas morio]|uniref:Uncharacterized protein n=1 Tax=Zophobas morio TaxID=2755281 RepID=A0AA38IP23_9CUCU|nr:hypothetical protein Zmor_005286 [Zophobas morio]
MTSLVMEKSYENCNKSPRYPEVQLRQKSPTDTSETQRKKRARNRLSNRRSTGFVSEDQVKAAMEMGAEGDKPDTSSNQ